jgi:hypothetical protein
MKKKGYEFVNFYEKLPDNIKGKNLPNPKFYIHKMNLPTRILVVGASGAGKSNTVLNLINCMSGTFTSIDIICKSADEPLYNYLKYKVKENCKIYEGIKNIPNIEDYKKDSNHLVIFDDLMLDKMDKIASFFIKSRKQGCTCIFISQSYIGNGTSDFRTIRRNCDYIILKKINSNNDLKLINREYDIGIDNNDFLKIYDDIISENFNNFLMIDISAPKNERFRRNFDVIKYN